jgi:glycerol-3-phosphate dehydrogenase
VLRLLREAVTDGAHALNYARADALIIEDGQVQGVRISDTCGEARTAEVRARVVINATGAWADGLRGQLDAPARIRPLRGSHLILPAWRLPVAQAVAFSHPFDGRPVFALPWEGVTLVGTTDLDHNQPLNDEPHISSGEAAYLMAAIAHQFPACPVTLDDVIATFAGVRPVIGTGKDDPSRESREHVIWQENGLLTVTGGKLTTFRTTALQVLREVRERLPEAAPGADSAPVFAEPPDTLPGGERLSEALRRRLLGRYGMDAPALIAAAQPGELAAIPGTQTLWAELRWAARAEAVCHLDDLLLRRVRLGLLLPQGGAALTRVRAICQPELGWDDARWQAEEAAYRALWREHYSLPPADLIPDWRTLLRDTAPAQPAPRRARLTVLLALAAAVALLALLARRSRPGHAAFRSE